jgi:hypothetical protein
VDPFAIDAGHPPRVRQCNYGREHGLWRPERAPDVKQSSQRPFGRWRAMLGRGSLEVMQQGENAQREVGRSLRFMSSCPDASKPEWAALALMRDRRPVRLS